MPHVSAYNTARDLLEILAEGYTITEAINAYENQSALPPGRLKGTGVDQKITIDSIVWENLGE